MLLQELISKGIIKFPFYVTIHYNPHNNFKILTSVSQELSGEFLINLLELSVALMGPMSKKESERYVECLNQPKPN